MLSPTSSVRPSGVIDRAVRERELLGGDARGPSGSTAISTSRHGSPPYMSKPKLPTYARPSRRRPCRCIGRARAPTGRRARRACRRVEPQHAPVEHRHDEHAAVGQPAETRRLLRHLDDRLVRCRRSSIATTPVVVLSENHSRSSCQRGPSGNASPSRTTSWCVRSWIGTVLFGTFGRADVVERLRVWTREAAARRRRPRSARRCRTARSTGRGRRADRRGARRSTSPVTEPRRRR